MHLSYVPPPAGAGSAPHPGKGHELPRRRLPDVPHDPGGRPDDLPQVHKPPRPGSIQPARPSPRGSRARQGHGPVRPPWVHGGYRVDGRHAGPLGKLPSLERERLHGQGGLSSPRLSGDGGSHRPGPGSDKGLGGAYERQDRDPPRPSDFVVPTLPDVHGEGLPPQKSRRHAGRAQGQLLHFGQR